MGLYISGKRLSDITTETGWAGSDILTGLKSGENKNITITELTTMVIDNVDTVDTLPPSTYAKVMYKGPVSWGASSLFVTDGSIVGIGLTAPNGGHQLEIQYDGTANNLLNMYKKDISDAVVKNITYSKTGILFIVDSSVPANIDSDSNANTYSSYFHKGIIANDDVFLNNANNSALKFGAFDIVTGVFTETSSVYGATDYLGLKAKIVETLDDTGTKYIGFTKNGTLRTSNSMFFSVQTWHDTSIAQSGGIILGSNALSSTIPDASVRSSLHIGGANAGVDNMLTLSLDDANVAHDDTLLLLKVDKTGKIFGRFPTAVGGVPSGALLQLYNDGGILKLG